jgi:hypothetical protein
MCDGYDRAFKSGYGHAPDLFRGTAVRSFEIRPYPGVRRARPTLNGCSGYAATGVAFVEAYVAWGATRGWVVPQQGVTEFDHRSRIRQWGRVGLNSHLSLGMTRS